MAKKNQGNQEQVSGDQVMPEQRDGEGNPSAAKDGESALSFSDQNPAIESKVNKMSPEEEAERQRAENFPRAESIVTFDAHEESEEARQGYAATSRAEIGRVVVVHEDMEYEGEVYKAGTQDLPLSVADAMISEGKAYEPAGKKKGR